MATDSVLCLADEAETLKEQIAAEAKNGGGIAPSPLYAHVQRRYGSRFGSRVLPKIELEDLVEKEDEWGRKAGPGKYIIRVTAPGSNKTLGTIQWEVIGDELPVSMPMPTPPPPPAAMTGPLDPSTVLMGMIQAQGQQTAATMQAMMSTVGTLIAAVVNRQPVERTPLADLRELLELVGDRSEAPAQNDLVSGIAKAIPDLLAAMHQEPARSPMPVPRPSPSVPVPMVIPSPEDRIATLLSTARPDLAEQAKPIAYVLVTAGRIVRTGEMMGHDAGDAAEGLVDFVGLDSIEQLAGGGGIDDIAGLLMVAAPDVSQDYARGVAGRVIEILREESDGDGQRAGDAETTDAGGERTAQGDRVGRPGAGDDRPGDGCRDDPG